MDMWLEAVPALLIALAWMLVPGAAFLGALGVRGLLLITAAPAASVALIAVVAVALSRLGIEWSPLSVVVVVVLLAAAAWLLRRFVFRRPIQPGVRKSWASIAIPWALAAMAVLVQLVIVWGRPDAISQTFDNGFHLNAVRYILDTGNASSLSLTGVISSGGAYPAAWHDLVSLVAMTPGISIPLAANMINVVVAAVVWPGALLLVARVIFPGRLAALIAAAVLSAVLPWFPLLMLTFGVLFPFFLATALLPVALALAFSLFRVGSDLGTSIPLRVITAGCALLAIGLAQPAVAFFAVAVALPAFGFFVVAAARSAASRGRMLAIVTAAVIAVSAFAAAWIMVGRMGMYAPWGPKVGDRFGLVETFLLFRDGQPPSFGLALFVIVGLVLMILTRTRLWLVGSWVISALLFFVAEAVGSPEIRVLFIGLFYKDPPRLAALFGVVCVVVGIVGAVKLWDVVSVRWDRRFPGRPITGTAGRILSVALFVVAAAAGQIPALDAASSAGRYAWGAGEWAPILSSDERVLLERLTGTTDPDAVIAGNPWTGTNLAYAIADRRVLNPHFNFSQDPDHVLLNSRLNEVASDPEVCATAERLGVEYALDFGSYFGDAAKLLSFDATAAYPGLLDLDTAPGFVEIDRVGPAALYRVPDCSS
ncbi:MULTISPECIES: DUF6541 family protein [unclassified Leifsonia]|uniref:DUF6541 family protein n=1 Tax=unclassified Leifsonia TaxID=2663824 RepID=UPI0006F3A405|nr:MULTISPECIES: DUF6541 family protein [unclassified Leifsonia]KQX06379.1 hypothetical protein ASC59_00405 [Leifsonia sp. Root1293]KRA10663.1 hypothetical protein ASD61_00405 [Leifsonia sp. Root60]